MTVMHLVYASIIASVPFFAGSALAEALHGPEDWKPEVKKN